MIILIRTFSSYRYEENLITAIKQTKIYYANKNLGPIFIARYSCSSHVFKFNLIFLFVFKCILLHSCYWNCANKILVVFIFY